ncbi:ileal sodium/bile acid cotransporter [Strongylocentrotus purpuratus]|uniref:Ileal sodium/bile acid cotransporter n=1 Tax=Strongylocentrotus purpuratus TaxID=7668 RepID=A0A7M7NXQ0_STRPU|nr:ileal sodium/bile acid cotransporter [Strongylocentrotus purpuratus]
MASTSPTRTAEAIYASLLTSSPSDVTGQYLVDEGVTANLTGLDDGSGNGTTNGRDIEALKLANQCVLMVTLGLTMVGMGAAIEPKDFKIVLRRPVGVGIGFVCQVILMPLIGFILALVLRMEPPHALGVLIAASSPGGTTSNLFTYWTDGDVCLSVVMTTISTVITLGSMPLNLFIYGRRWTDRGAVIPYKDIIIALVAFIGPVGLGMLLRWRSKKWGIFVGKPLGVIGMLGIITSIIITVFINPNIWASSWKLYVASLLHMWIGWSLGYTLARLLRQPHKQSRTIAFETGLQQIGIAMTLISFSYKDDTELFLGVIVYPMFFGPFSIISFGSWTLAYKIFRHFRPETESEVGDDVGSDHGEDKVVELQGNRDEEKSEMQNLEQQETKQPFL